MLNIFLNYYMDALIKNLDVLIKCFNKKINDQIGH